MFCYSTGRIKLEGFLNVVVKSRIGKSKENKMYYEKGGHPYRNYVPKYERKRLFGKPALRIRIRIACNRI
jgi:hypothetical protein